MNEISGGEIAVAHEFPWAVRIFGGCAQGNIDLLYRNSTATSPVHVYFNLYIIFIRPLWWGSG